MPRRKMAKHRIWRKYFPSEPSQAKKSAYRIDEGAARQYNKNNPRGENGEDYEREEVRIFMKEFDYTIQDALGIHARPAGQLVKVVKGFASKVTLTKGEKTIDATRLMSLMGMGVKQGDTVTIKVEGDDEDATAADIEKFMTENL